MGSIEVRETPKKLNLWGGYKDELVATAMTLSLLVLGSFLLTERLLINPPDTTPDVVAPTVLPALTPIPLPAAPQTLGAEDVAPTPSASPGAEPLTEVPYGQDGDYDVSQYSISFRNPRVTFNAKTNTQRKLMVNVWVKNKTMVDGLLPRLTASIIKDGVVIVPQAALYIPRLKTLQVGDEFSFSASLGLIEGTDVRELKFTPGADGVETSHFLYP